MFVNFAESVINLILKQPIYYYHEQDCVVLLHFILPIGVRCICRTGICIGLWQIYTTV